MNIIFVNILKVWFEIRIFISLTIVSTVTLLSFLVFRTDPAILELIGRWLGWTGRLSVRYSYLIIASFVLLATLIRMWAGSVLTSSTVMAFKVQDNKLIITGPYQFVRNPIYFADLIVFIALSFCLRPVGLLIPILIYLHYCLLIRYEEANLKKEFGRSFDAYVQSTPMMIPGFRQLCTLRKKPLNFFINYDGFRHNAQYTLFIPGLIVAAYTGHFIHAILVALPAIIDWAIIHTTIGLAKKRPGNRGVSHSNVFKDILYAQCWEDPELDRIAFQIKPEDTMLTITSGGCNALAFLLDDPKKIICLDMNKYQNYLLSLKINAFKTLAYKELLEFLGVVPSRRRWQLFERVRPLLPEEEQSYWTAKRMDINRGIIHCGRYERFMHLLKQLFRLMIGPSVIRELYQTQNVEERRQLVSQKWENRSWRLFCRLFLSRTVASLFFDNAFYRYLEPSFSFEAYYRSAVRRALTELPLKENYFLAYMLLGNYYEDNYPLYLRPENYDIIRNRTDRIELITSGCVDYFSQLPSASISKFNFTNIFEWMSLDEFASLLKETVRVSKPDAVMTYRNHLVTRHRPESMAREIEPDDKLSEMLHNKDLSFIYKAYVVERIVKNKCSTG
ncbi:MAG: DUF3419 family protein [Bacteroidota bacterium]|nr:DUF3419 family protein [Bacteroidota bacterium]